MELRHAHFVQAAIAGGVFALLATNTAAAAPSEGLKLASQHCMQCHEVKGAADFGNVGPSLTDLKERYPDRKDVTAIVFDETKRNPQTVMPPFGRNLILSDKEIQTVVDFLYSQ